MSISTNSFNLNTCPIFTLKSAMKVTSLSIILFYAGFAFAVEKVYQFSDATQEAIYYSLVNELRCLVCQNQNLADSNAELAEDLRNKTWELVVNGASKAEVIDFMTARYGEFVLYRPPFKISTAMLWLGPFIMLGTGIFVIVVLIRRHQEPQEFSRRDRARARELLEGRDEAS